MEAEMDVVRCVDYASSESAPTPGESDWRRCAERSVVTVASLVTIPSRRDTEVVRRHQLLLASISRFHFVVAYDTVNQQFSDWTQPIDCSFVDVDSIGKMDKWVNGFCFMGLELECPPDQDLLPFSKWKKLHWFKFQVKWTQYFSGDFSRTLRSRGARTPRTEHRNWFLCNALQQIYYTSPWKWSLWELIAFIWVLDLFLINVPVTSSVNEDVGRCLSASVSKLTLWVSEVFLCVVSYVSYLLLLLSVKSTDVFILEVNNNRNRMPWCSRWSFWSVQSSLCCFLNTKTNSWLIVIHQRGQSAESGHDWSLFTQGTSCSCIDFSSSMQKSCIQSCSGQCRMSFHYN